MGEYAVFKEDKMKSNPFGDNRIYVDTTPEKIDFDVFNTSVEQYKKTHKEDNEKPLDILVNALNINPPDFLYYYSDIITIDINNGVLRTAWFEKPDNLCSIKIDKKWNSYYVNKDEYNVDYLRLVLFKETQKLKENLTEGDTIKLSDVLNMEIMIPISVDEQRELYEEEKMNYLIEKARKEGLDEAIKRMKDEYMSEVRIRKHDMKPFLSQLDSQAKLVSFYLDKVEGNDDVVAAMKTKVSSMIDIVNELRTHLNRLTEEDIYGEPERMNLKDALIALEGNMESYQVAVRIDELALQDAKIEAAEVMMSPVDFSTLANTIIENAVTHAFVDEGAKYKIHISMTVNKETGRFIIDIKNDGAPMPTGMNKYRYGLKGEKGAKSKGSGLGGYRVKSITHHYGGDYDVFSNHKGLTTIRVELPIYRHNEKV